MEHLPILKSIHTLEPETDPTESETNILTIFKKKKGTREVLFDKIIDFCLTSRAYIHLLIPTINERERVRVIIIPFREKHRNKS